MTVVCPFDCEYLRESRLHERLPEISEADLPNRDIALTDRFLAQNDELLSIVGQTLYGCTEQNPDINDNDVREGLDALIRTYRTLQSGLYYESRPTNPMALFVYDQVQQLVARLREATRQTGRESVRDVAMLGVLAFFRRAEAEHNNGRRKGRAFLDFLRQNLMLGEIREVPPDTPLIVP